MTKQRLIDANEAIGIAKEYYWVFERSRANLTDLREVLKDCTTIEAKPVVHAHWEECNWIEYDGYGECIRCPKSGLRCSNCNNVFKKELLWKENYCPNCGAQMDEDIEHVNDLQ